MVSETLISILAVSLAVVATSSWAFEIKDKECRHEIVESMPDELTFNGTLSFKPAVTHEVLINMIDNAKKTLRIASFYWILTAPDEFALHPSTVPGKKIMEAVEAAVKRGVNLEVVVDHSSNREKGSPDDLKRLEQLGTVRYLNMTLLLGNGVLHSKFLIADSETFYVGSSNFDWRSYTQIKEIGIGFYNCPVLGQDLDKIFRTYKLMSELKRVPNQLPVDLKTDINIDAPLRMKLDDISMKLFLGGAPPAFNGIKEWTGRTDDIDGLLHILDRARHRLDVSVMNYSPRTQYIWPKKFWPRIEDALRRAAAERNIKVRLLFSNWTQTKPEDIMWYRSLNALQSKGMRGSVEVRLFKVPAFDAFQKSIPFARVKHDKYMVTDRGLFIGTSNWTPDYFINTCGVGLVIEPESKHGGVPASESGSIIRNMQELFERDWHSSYAEPLATDV